MKKLNYADYMNGDITIKCEDLDIVLKNFDKEIDMFYDEQGRIYNEAGTYIADLEN